MAEGELSDTYQGEAGPPGLTLKVVRDTLRELLWGIPGFYQLAE